MVNHWDISTFNLLKILIIRIVLNSIKFKCHSVIDIEFNRKKMVNHWNIRVVYNVESPDIDSPVDRDLDLGPLACTATLACPMVHRPLSYIHIFESKCAMRFFGGDSNVAGEFATTRESKRSVHSIPG